MMPGENHSKTATIASYATAGTCQNCAVLTQNANEYVAAFLTLKQKIIDTDHLLTEYQEKCDELQKSQRESSKLQQQLDELQLKMAPLEKRNEEYEAMRSELEEKRSSLKVCQERSVELDGLRKEKLKTMAQKEKLEKRLKTFEETTAKQSLENVKLRTEKEALAKALQETRISLKQCQQRVGEVQHLKEENSKTLTRNRNLECEFMKLEDSAIRQNQDMVQLKMDKERLEKDLHKAQKKLEKMESRMTKDLRNVSTQITVPEEPKIDKAKFRCLLEELRTCVEPPVFNQWQFTGFHCESSNFLVSPSTPTTVPEQTGRLPKTEVARHGKRKRKSERPSSDRIVAEDGAALAMSGNVGVDGRSAPFASGGRGWSYVDEILDLFRPLPPPLSPVQLTSPNTQVAGPLETLFGVISDSSDDEPIKDRDTPTVLLGPNDNRLYVPHQDVLLCTKTKSMDLESVNELFVRPTTSVSEENEPMRSSPSPCDSLQSAHCTKAGSAHEDNFKGSFVTSAPPSEEMIYASPSRSLSNGAEPKLPFSWNEEMDTSLYSTLVEGHTVSPPVESIPNVEQKGIPPSASVPEMQDSGCTEQMLCENSGLCEDIKMQSPSAKKESDIKTERQNSPDALNIVIDDDKTNQIVSKESLETDEIKVLQSLGTYEALAKVCNGHKEESTVFQSGNGMLNTMEIAMSSKTPCFPEDKMDQVKEQEENCSLVQVSTDTATVLTQITNLPAESIPSITASHLVDEVTNLEVPQTLEVNNLKSASEAECPRQMDKVPTELAQTSSLSITSAEMVVENNDSILLQPCGTKSLADTSAAADPSVGKEKIKLSSSVDTAEGQDSLEEQECFPLQRKVKTVNQRGVGQASAKEVNVSVKSAEDSLAKHNAPEEVQEPPGESWSSGERSLNADSERMASDNYPQARSDPSTKGALLETEECRTGSDDDGAKVIERESVSGLVKCGDKVHLENQSAEDHEKHLEVFLPSQQLVASNLTPPSTKLLSVVAPIAMPDSQNGGDKADDGGASPADDAQPDSNPTDLGFSWQSCNDVLDGAKESGRGPIPTNPAVLAVAGDSISAKSPELMRKVRTEIGLPLPPLLLPLTATPPKPGNVGVSSKSIPAKLSFPSPMSELGSPLQGGPSLMTPLADEPKGKSPSLVSPSPSDAKCRRTLSSPLQFCSATPKHAVPVPGRFPPSAINSSGSSPIAPQENSVRILDTMYPELSARARTLNILRGNVSLCRSAPENGVAPPAPVGQISGFKSINSSSTAFTKTGKSCETENADSSPSVEDPDVSESSSSATPALARKRLGVNTLLPRSAKRLRLDNSPQTSANVALPVGSLSDSRGGSQVVPQETETRLHSEKEPQNGNQRDAAERGTPNTISKAITKVLTACFDILPVIRSHVCIGRISKTPVLRDEEKEVIHEFCTVNKALADNFLSDILTKIKTEKNTLGGDRLQALCRLYTGMCRQRGDWERVHLLAYSVLKEDFPEPAKLILYMVTTWVGILPHTAGIVCNAMHAVVRQRASGEVLQFLTVYLDWEKNPPNDVQKMVTNILVALRMGSNMKFQKHDRHGDDLSPIAWEYIYALDLLCTHQRWNWTHDNLICKELWPIMNKWVTQSRTVRTPSQDASVACVLRLIGRLGQLGIKEKSIASVKNVAKIINTFGRHGKAEGVPWAVQLAAVYTIYDLSPSNPKEALEALAAWREETVQPVPPAVTSCITQIGSICRHVKS